MLFVNFPFQYKMKNYSDNGLKNLWVGDGYFPSEWDEKSSPMIFSAVKLKVLNWRNITLTKTLGEVAQRATNQDAVSQHEG